MKPRPTLPWSRPGPCLAASLAAHAAALGVLGWAVSWSPPRLTPEAGRSGITVTVVSVPADLPSPAASSPQLQEPPAPAPSAPPEPASVPVAEQGFRTDRLTLPAPPLPLATATSSLTESKISPASLPIRAITGPVAGGQLSAGADTSPRLIRSPAPAYPPAARRAGQEGTVRLRVVITASGRVAEAVIVQSSGRHDLDQAAQQTVLRDWLYTPARRGGLAQMAEETVRIEFRLRG